MSAEKLRNRAASVKARLLTLARERREELQSVLTRYAAERFLYRLSVSPYRADFVLKGASLFTLWLGTPHRATRDLDLLGFGSPAVVPTLETFRAICRQDVDDDGLVFGADTVQVVPAREAEKYAGLRVTFKATLGSAVIPVQVDIGFGDAITPPAQEAELPTLLDVPAVRLRTYPRETVVAEKCEAMVDLGMANSRLKDFYDLHHLARQFDFTGPLLCQALAATFERRGTALPTLTPTALTEQFYADAARSRQWQVFCGKSALPTEAFIPLDQCMKDLALFLLPPLRAAREGTGLEALWRHKAFQWSRAGHEEQKFSARAGRG